VFHLRLAFVAAAVVGTAAGAAVASAPTIRFTSPPTGLAAEPGSLWVSVAADDTLLRLDARTGRRLALIDVHRADRRALGGGTLAASGNKLWIAAPVHVDGDPSIGNASGWIGRIDTRTRKLRITQVYGDPPSQVAVGPAGVWVTGGRTVRRVNVTSGDIVGTVRLPAYLGAVAVGASAVWVDEPNMGRLIEIDPRTLRVRGSVKIGPSTLGSSLTVVGHVVWAATNDGVVSVDQRSRRVGAVLRIPGAHAVRFDGSRLWVVARGGMYSVAGQKVTKVSSDQGDLLAIANGVVWLSEGFSNSLRRIQP
jgi:hypothetical protein